MEKVKWSAPGKLILFGEYAVLYGFPCIGMAVDKRIFCEVEKIKESKIFVLAPDIKVKKLSISIEEIDERKEREVEFLLKTLSLFFKKYQTSFGLKIKTKSQFSSLYGLGSSSATVVSLFSSLCDLFKVNVSKKDIFNFSFDTVLKVQGVGSGVDVAISTFGGVVYYIKPGKTIEKLKTREMPLIVAYTGKKVNTSKIVKKVNFEIQRNKRYYEKIFFQISEIVKKAKIAIESKNWKELGILMQQNQEMLRKFQTPSLKYGVSSQTIEKIIKSAMKAGAFGAKLSGAGLGDCVLILGEDKEKIEKAVKSVGGIPLNLNLDFEGVKKEI
jgi:mevalonate kinase